MSETATNIRARFFKEPVENPFLSQKEGRPIFEEIEMVELSIPGDRLTRHVALANEWADNRNTRYLDKYPDEYAAFKRGEEAPIKGTPLEAWPLVTRSRVMELKALGVMTVDELAVVSDHLVTRLGADGRNLREQALAFINQARDGAAQAAQASRIADLEARIDQLMRRSEMAPALAPADVETVDINDATDEQLKQFIKEQTGEAPRGRVARETLIQRVQGLTAQSEEAA